MASSSLETEDVESRDRKRDLGDRLAAVGAPARCRRVLANDHAECASSDRC